MLMSYFSYSEPVQIAGVIAAAIVISVFLCARAAIKNSERDYQIQQQRWKDNGDQRIHEKKMQDERLAAAPKPRRVK